jgi:DNA repair protein RadC
MTSADQQSVPLSRRDNVVPISPRGTDAATVVEFPAAPSTVESSPPTALRGDEHPATRLRRHGVATLSDSELVTLLTRSRVRTDADLRPARALLRDGLPALLRRVESRAGGVRAADAVRLAAAMELARRALEGPAKERDRFNVDLAGPRLVARYALHVQERLGVLYLDSRGRVIEQREVFVGTLHTAFVSTRDILRVALDLHALSIVLFHNHPSGEPTPSEEDVAFTVKVQHAAQLLDIFVVDHLVLGRSRYVSMKRRGDF